MLNEERIRLMTKLARYEQKEGRRNLKISRYYRRDYLGIKLLKNFFTVTIGYCLMLALICGYYVEYLLDNIHKMDLKPLITEVIIGYLLVMVFYMVITYMVYSVKWVQAKKSVKGYYAKLSELSVLYAREEKRQRSKNNGRNEE